MVIVGFTARDDSPEAGLKRVFGLDEAAARQLVASLPATVQSGVNRVRAEYFRKALDMIGAQVEVRDPSGKVEPPPGVPNKEPIPPAPAVRQLAAAAEPAVGPPAMAAPIMPVAAPTAFGAPLVRPEPPAGIAPVQLPPPSPVEATPLGAARPPTPLEIATQPAAFGATVAMRDAPQPAAASAPVFAPPAAPTTFAAPVAQGSANATLKEGVAIEALLARTPGPAARDTSAAATADTHELPTTAFRFGDTHAPFMRGILGDAPAADAPAAAPAAPGPSALSFNLPMPLVAALPAGAAVAPVQLPTPTATPADDAFGWGEIERGRHSQRPAAGGSPAPADAQRAAQAPGLELDVPARGAAAPAPAIAAAPPSRAIDANAKIAAPSAREMAAAIRKQQIFGHGSGLGAERADTPKADDIMRAAEREVKVARRRAHGLEGALPGAVKEPAKPAAAAATADAATPANPASPAARVAPAVRAKPIAATPTPAQSKRPVAPHSFWESIGPSLTFLLRGDGLAWWTHLTLWSIGASAVIYATGFLGVLGTGLAFLARTSLLAFCADLHRQAFWKTVEGGSELDRRPSLDFGHVLRSYFGAGLHLSLFTLLSQAPLVYWTYGTYFPSVGADDNPYLIVLSPLFWVLAMGPAFYWPMALATSSARNDLGAVWNVPLGVRALSRAPGEYATLVGLGALCLVATWGPLLLIGFAAHLPQLYFDATMGLGLAFSSAVMGALSGNLARARPALFQ